MRRSGEKGQNLIVASLTMAALAGMLALLVDAGMLLAMRRRAQNAADAGALAGVWELMNEGSDENVYNRIDYYTVVRNGATSFSAVYEPDQNPVCGGRAGLRKG